MRDLYIGEFFNPEEAKESWEDYVKRKKREDDGKLKGWQQAILVIKQMKSKLKRSLIREAAGKPYYSFIII
jgi:hypothetical protein